jgi:hypothetical protein
MRTRRAGKLSNRVSQSSPGRTLPGMARGAHVLSARSLALAMVAVGTLSVTAAQAHEPVATKAPAQLASGLSATIVRKAVASTDHYRVVVSLRARGKRSERATVYVTGQAARTTHAAHTSSTRLVYELKAASARRLVVDAVARRPGVKLSVTMSVEQPATPKVVTTTPAASPAVSSGSTGSSGASGPTGATGSTPPAGGTSAPVAPAPPAAPTFTNPYTTLAWSDTFTQDFATANAQNHAAQEPLNDASNAWGLDNWGDCGGSESTSPTTGAAAASVAYLTSAGLNLPAVTNGSSYYAAQVDSGSGANPVSVGVGETIEASMTLPVGQGLCPAFWLVSKGGVGEIDVIEAPAFVGPQWGPTAPYSIFTLHANDAQQFELPVTPSGWNPAVPNVYGLTLTSTAITWTVNGVAYATATASSLANPALWSDVTSGAFSIMFDVAVGGWPGNPPAGTVYTQPMQVQWVKVYN